MTVLLKFLMLGLAFFFSALPSTALGQDNLIRQATDSDAANAFGENPGAYLPKEMTTGVMVQQRTDKHSIAVEGNNPSTSTFGVLQNRTNLAFMNPSGPAFAFGLTGMVDQKNVEGEFERNAQRTRLIETYQTTEAGMRLVLGLTEKARFGFVIRYQAVQTNIVGSFNADESDRTKYRGTLFGYGLGVLFGDKNANLGIAWLPPLKGKAQVEGESKILTEPGMTMVHATFALDQNLKVGGAARKWAHKRDDRVKVSTSPINMSQIILAGTDAERDLLIDQEVQAGLDIGVGGTVGMRLSGASQQAEFVFDPEENVGDADNEENRFSSYIATAALQIKGQKSDFQIGVCVHPRTHTLQVGSQERKYKGDARTAFVSMSIGM